MVEVIVSEHVRYRNTLEDTRASLHVKVWDIGPEKATKPAKPIVPKEAKPGTVEYDILQIKLREAVANYEKQLAHYVTQLKDHDQWHARHSGRVVFEQWSVDAADTFRNDGRAVARGAQSKRRYYRYDPKAPRLGLPVGVEPGQSHREQIERQAEADQAAAIARRSDPVFGEHE